MNSRPGNMADPVDLNAVLKARREPSAKSWESNGRSRGTSRENDERLGAPRYGGVTPPAASHRFPVKWLRWAIAGAVMLVFALQAFFLYGRSHGLTVSEYRSSLWQNVNSELADPSSKTRKLFFKRIEDAHWTVTVTSGIVTKCEIETLDGSDRIGWNGSNIASVTMEIKFGWKGIIEPGYTTIEIVRGGKNLKEVVSSRIVDSSAVWNSEDTDCWLQALEVALNLL